MSSSSQWRRCAGFVSAPEARAGRAQAFLEGAGVVAVIEIDTVLDDVVTVTVAVDDERMVGVLSPEGQITAGPSLEDLATALAGECDGFVAFDDVIAETIDDPENNGDDDPFGFGIENASAQLPERAVVVTKARVRDLEDLVTEANTTLYAREHDGGQVAFLEEGPALTSLDWRPEHLPVVLLEQGDAHPAVTVINAEGEAHIHTWDVQRTIVPSTQVDVVQPFVTDTLGVGALTRDLLTAGHDANTDALLAALELDGELGLPALALGLGLPEVAADFLRGQTPASEVPDTVELDPMTISEQVRRAMDDVADEARAQVEQMRETADEYRAQALAQIDEAREAARRHAQEAYTEVQGIADPDQHPTLAWTTPALGLLQGAAAIFALRRALDKAQVAAPAAKWWGLTAGIFGTAATANLALTALPWAKRLRERGSAQDLVSDVVEKFR